jgi:hypothetical protein
MRQFWGGMIASLIVFGLLGAIWQITHGIWVVGIISLIYGGLAIAFQQSFRDMLNTIVDAIPDLY